MSTESQPSLISQVGSHISKVKGSFEKSLQAYYGKYISHCLAQNIAPRNLPPCQIFLRPNRSCQMISPTESDLRKAHDYILEYDIHFYVHSPYLINLSNPEKTQKVCGTENSNPQAWAPWVLKEDLQLCSQMGGRGVVVHMGKRLKDSESQALDKMYQTVLEVAMAAATEETPLLLETSAGQGSELCWKYDDFRDFYRRFTADEKKIIKICIDTCHIWAGDNDPLEYLTKWESEFGLESIALIHFNDSKGKRGCRVDRHEIPGEGEIGLERMTEVLVWAQSRKVDCIFE